MLVIYGERRVSLVNTYSITGYVCETDQRYIIYIGMYKVGGDMYKVGVEQSGVGMMR